jgi:hypothetical protein
MQTEGYKEVMLDHRLCVLIYLHQGRQEDVTSLLKDLVSIKGYQMTIVLS